MDIQALAKELGLDKIHKGFISDYDRFSDGVSIQKIIDDLKERDLPLDKVIVDTCQMGLSWEYEYTLKELEEAVKHKLERIEYLKEYK